MTFSGDEHQDGNYWQLIQWNFSLPLVALLDDLQSERDTCQQRYRRKVLCEWRTWVNVEAVKKKKYSRDYISDGIMTFFITVSALPWCVCCLLSHMQVLCLCWMNTYLCTCKCSFLVFQSIWSVFLDILDIYQVKMCENVGCH